MYHSTVVDESNVTRPIVRCDCGCSGPAGISEEDATRGWNKLSKAVKRGMRTKALTVEAEVVSELNPPIPPGLMNYQTDLVNGGPASDGLDDGRDGAREAFSRQLEGLVGRNVYVKWASGPGWNWYVLRGVLSGSVVLEQRPGPDGFPPSIRAEPPALHPLSDILVVRRGDA
ncbi:MAG: hypothetical protein IPH08_03740 [Rhodocyclaceae bacterium]|nr:hypothetical protein [Rhodocyclaceae bacterium]